LAQTSRRAVRDAINASARDIAAEAQLRHDDLSAAMARAAGLLDQGKLNPPAVADMARRGDAEEVICSLALLAQVQASLATRAVVEGDHDLLLTIARSIDLDWDIVRAIMSIRKERRPGPRQFEALAESYARLTMPTAQRLLRYLHAREEVSAAGQRRTNVR
jgi:hypothetical protein